MSLQSDYCAVQENNNGRVKNGSGVGVFPDALLRARDQREPDTSRSARAVYLCLKSGVSNRTGARSHLQTGLSVRGIGNAANGAKRLFKGIGFSKAVCLRIGFRPIRSWPARERHNVMLMVSDGRQAGTAFGRPGSPPGCNPAPIAWLAWHLGAAHASRN